MKKLALVLICILMLITLVACGGKTCQHRDADDNSLCDKCGESYTDGKDVFDEHTHAYNVKNTDSQYLATAADCQNPATYYYSCSCGIKGTQIFSSGSVVAHKISGDACTLCGFKNSTPGLEFSLNSDGKTYTVTGIGTCEEKSIVIGLYNNMIVTGIGDSAFEDCNTLTSITIPSSVQKVENYAFYNCSNLQTVTFGENSQLSNISASAFEDCTSLTSITIPSSVQKIDEDAFSGCSNLQTVTFGANSQLSSIGSYAFFNCTSLTSITVPDSVTNIGSYAFRYCDSLTSITIPDSVTSIGDGAFSDCSRLTSIHVGTGNENYKSIDGNLYTKDGKTLIQYAMGKKNTSFTIPDVVTSIGAEAFRDCTSLTSITIPSSVQKVNDYAFYNCSNLETVTFGANSQLSSIGYRAFYECTRLTSITIPSSVQKVDDHAFNGCSNLQTVTFGANSQLSSIGSYAFYYCTSLTSIKYRGTQAQWNAISKGPSWNYNTGNCTITYNYTGE